MTLDAGYMRRLLDETREEVSRADTKASIILAGGGIVVGILLTGFVTGDVSIAGERWYVALLAWAAGALLVGGVAFLGSAVYPRTRGAQPGHADGSPRSSSTRAWTRSSSELWKPTSRTV